MVMKIIQELTNHFTAQKMHRKNSKEAENNT